MSILTWRVGVPLTLYTIAYRSEQPGPQSGAIVSGRCKSISRPTPCDQENLQKINCHQGKFLQALLIGVTYRDGSR